MSMYHYISSIYHILKQKENDYFSIPDKHRILPGVSEN